MQPEKKNLCSDSEGTLPKLVGPLLFSVLTTAYIAGICKSAGNELDSADTFGVFIFFFIGSLPVFREGRKVTRYVGIILTIIGFIGVPLLIIAGVNGFEHVWGGFVTIIVFLFSGPALAEFGRPKKPATNPDKKQAEKMTLEQFLPDWSDQYTAKVSLLPLFNPIEWTKERREVFVRMFYDGGGHFDRLLFLIGSRATDERLKNVVLDKIKDEFGGSKNSYEELYLEFALSQGFDVSRQILNPDSCHDFSHGHLVVWFGKHDADHRLAATAACQMLDNVDYQNLERVAVGMGATGRALVFFEVRRNVPHFGALRPLLAEVWESSPESVKAGFDFIGEQQIELWRKLGEEILRH